MKLRTIVLASAAILALTTSASAVDTSWYVGIGAGINFPNAASVTVLTPTNNPTFKADFDTTWRGIASVGYAWDNHVRLEGEFGYTDPDIDGLCYSRQCVKLSSFQMAADLQQITLMANLLYDAPISDKWYFTFGAGVGIGFTTLSGQLPNYGSGDESANGLAWQGIVGFTYKLSDTTDLQLDYRYVSIEHLMYGTAPDAAKISQLTSNNAMLTLRWYFDQPPPPPVAPPPPPPPPPLPPPVKTFIVFFDFNKANLTESALGVVAEAVKTAKTNGFVKVQIVGNTDTVGSDKYNMTLSVARAESVKDEMVREGMDGSTIAIEGRGFHDLLVPTGPGVREPQNRRAVIDLAS